MMAVNYTNVVEVACTVKPSWAQQIQATPQQTFDGLVNAALALDLSTVQNRINALTSQITGFTPSEISRITNSFNSLQYITDPVMWASCVNNLNAQAQQFTLPQAEKDTFISSLQILRSSFVLWNGLELICEKK